MASRRTASDPNQGDLFFEPAPPPRPIGGSLNMAVELCEALALAIEQSGKTRPEIAAELTHLVFGDAPTDPDGETAEITKAQLDAWTSRGKKGWRFPVEYLPAFVHVTGAPWLLDLVARRAGCRVLVGQEALLAELGAVMLAERRAKEARANLSKRIPGELLDRLMQQLEARHAVR